mgnify:CR=1 FL=1
MSIYLSISLMVMVGIIICCKDVLTGEDVSPNDACIYAMVILGWSISWPLFIARVIVEIYKGR